MFRANENIESGVNSGGLSQSLTFILACATAFIIMNLHTAQTILGPIASDLSIPPSLAGFAAMAPLAGYAIGLIFVVPLSDVIENRRLVMLMLVAATVAAGVASIASNAVVFLSALLLLGVSCSCIQILVPIAASLAPLEHRGRAVGNVMAGVMVGVLAARPFASFVADSFGWRFVYAAGALAMAGIILVLRLSLPRVPAHNSAGSYPRLILSLWDLLRDETMLRRRATTAALMMTAFSMFWSTIALRLAAAPSLLSQKEIALFALVGAGGVLATPFAGGLGDRNRTSIGTIAAHITVALSMVLAAWVGTTSGLPVFIAIGLLGVCAVALDVGLTTDHTLGRRIINLTRPEARGRMNGLFVGLFFIGGALGAALSGFTWAWGGWWLTCIGAAAFAMLALFLDLVWAWREKRHSD